jgi:hypothetical protein
VSKSNLVNNVGEEKEFWGLEEFVNGNVVDNYLNIYGQPRYIQDFYLESTRFGKRLSFEAYIPIPKETPEEELLTSRFKLWGVCYDIQDTDLIVLNNNSHIYYEFGTIATAPITWLKRMVLRYETLEFELRYQLPQNTHQNVVRGSKCHIFQL